MNASSRRTTAAGVLSGLALVLYGVSQILTGRAVDVGDLLLLIAGAGLVRLGAVSRDDGVTSEGTRAELRRRGQNL